MKRILPMAAFVVSMLLQTGQAWAHATPVEYVPASSSVIDAAPKTVSIRFSERIDPAASSITVYGPDGATVDSGNSKTNPRDAHVFLTTLQASGTGTYTVSWQVVSADDGHFTKGGFVFSVGAKTQGGTTSVGQFQIQHRSDWPQAILIWIELLGEAMLIGMLGLLMTVGHGMQRQGISASTESLLHRRLRLLLWSAGALLLMGTIGYLMLEASNLAVDRSVTFAASLSSFLNAVAGRYALYRLIIGVFAVVLFGWTLKATVRSKKNLKSELIILGLLIAIDLLRARVSHAAASDVLPVVSILINAVHLFSKDLWIGSLVVLTIAVLPALNLERNGTLMIRTLLRIHSLILSSLAVGGATGAYIVWLHLKSLSNLLTTHWGGYFLTLAAYAAVFLLLRVYQHVVLHPALVRAAAGKKSPKETETLKSASTVILSETLLGVAVLLFSSVMIITTPPRSEGVFAEQRATSGNATILFGDHHFETDQFAVTITRTVPSPSSASGVVTVTLQNDEKNIGPIVATLEKRFPGGYVFPQHTLSPPGTWTVTVNETEPGTFDANATFTVRYPDDVTAARLANASRTFGGFEAALVILALMILAVAWLLQKQTMIVDRRIAGMTDIQPLPSLHLPTPWLTVPIDLFIVASITIFLGGHAHGSGNFALDCTRVGGTWHENVPMREGQVTSDISALGCMLGSGAGTFHFADAREFAYFARRTDAYATLDIDPQTIEPGKPVTLNFHLKEAGNKPVTDLTLEHDRILHAMIVSSDFAFFQHLHAENDGPITPSMLSAATFPVRATFPKSGTYLVAVDFTVRAQSFSKTFPITVGNATDTKPSLDSSLTQTTGDLRVTLVPPARMKAGMVQKLNVRFEKPDGTPVTDLQPYLSAAAHVSVVSTDLHTFIHTHAEPPQSLWDRIFNARDPAIKHIHVFLPERMGPTLTSYVLFPLPGQYVIVVETNRNGAIVVTKFLVNIQ